MRFNTTFKNARQLIFALSRGRICVMMWRSWTRSVVLCRGQPSQPD